jgi:hypothetical protein
MLIRLFQQRPRYWFSVRNRHNIWLSRTDKLKQPDKHKLARPADSLCSTAIPLPSSGAFLLTSALVAIFRTKEGRRYGNPGSSTGSPRRHSRSLWFPGRCFWAVLKQCGPILTQCGPEGRVILSECGPGTNDVFGPGHLCSRAATPSTLRSIQWAADSCFLLNTRPKSSKRLLEICLNRFSAPFVPSTPQ